MNRTIIRRVLVVLFLSYGLSLFLLGCGATIDGFSGIPPIPSGNSVTLQWRAPDTNSDGSDLTDLAGYRIYYGLNKNDIITASTHLLDHLMQKDGNLNNSNGFYNKDFTIDSIKDLWNSQNQFIIDNVSISPLKPAMYSQVALWMRNPAIKYSFISMFPDSESALKHYFERLTCDYFCIFYHNEKRCLIHPVKPSICSLWPFYPALVKDRDNWEVAKDACPGMKPDCSFEEFIKQSEK